MNDELDIRQRHPNAYSLLDKLRGELLMAEFEVRQDMDKLRNYYRDEDGAKRRWTRFRRETEDLRANIEYIIAKIAKIEGMRPPQPIVVPAA